MTDKQFDFDTNNLVDASAIDTRTVAQRIYDRLGVRFPIQFRGDADRTPVVDMAAVPDSVTESELKNAIQKSHPRADGDPAPPR